MSHEEQFFKTAVVDIGPPPAQRPHPPIWMGGNAEICGTGSFLSPSGQVGRREVITCKVDSKLNAA